MPMSQQAPSSSAAAPLRPPSVRSLLLLQNHVASGVFAPRHLKALADDDKSLEQIYSLAECIRAHQQFVANAPPEKQRSAQTRNMVCVCRAVCPSETVAWVDCYRSVLTARRKAKAGQLDGPLPNTNCEELRHRLEVCTQHASSRLMHAAILPRL